MDRLSEDPTSGTLVRLSVLGGGDEALRCEAGSESGTGAYLLG